NRKYEALLLSVVVVIAEICTYPHCPTDEYQCTGNAETDFPALCALLNVKDIPAVIAKFPASSPCLTLELESKDRARSMKVSGWRVNEQIFRVLEKMLPSMNQLQSLGFWQAGLTDRMVVALMNTIPLCSSLRVVALEGNVLPQQGYHLLLSEDSVLTHLSLRNNRIGVEGARLIGSALSTARSANKNLLSLNLAFNRICDAGAALIAQGLRLNRTLLFLSLCNNQVGDAGAAQLAAVLREFALTHDEIVERRKLLLKRVQAVRVAVSFTELTLITKCSEYKNIILNDGADLTVLREQAELVDPANPLLHPSVDPRDGQVFMSGNTTLVSLNLAGQQLWCIYLCFSGKSKHKIKVKFIYIAHLKPQLLTKVLYI
uniref:Leucine rich repeat containing 71 n=2 Tax=Haplochromini TaxID=319058 RepID=A0A3Q3CY68_HAPBU